MLLSGRAICRLSLSGPWFRGCDRFRRPRKFGSPPLVAPSLKVQGDDTHNNSVFFVDLTPSITKQLRANGDGHNCVPNKIERIFCRCWNLITPSWSCACRASQATDSLVRAVGTKPASATFLESCRGHPVYITGRPDYAGASVMRAADDPAEQFSPQLGVRTPEIESREEHRVKRKPTAEEGTQD